MEKGGRSRSIYNKSKYGGMLHGASNGKGLGTKCILVKPAITSPLEHKNTSFRPNTASAIIYLMPQHTLNHPSTIWEAIKIFKLFSQLQL
jgi:hypothetical protein